MPFSRFFLTPVRSHAPGTSRRTNLSSNTAARSQVILKNIVAAFALFDSPTFNGFKFTLGAHVAIPAGSPDKELHRVDNG